jgi:sugar lactone lactonase YvrE
MPAGNGTVVGALVLPSELTGFESPFLGTPRFAQFSATKVAGPSLVEKVGRAGADELAASLGFPADKVMTNEQYLKFVTGQGVGGDLSQAILVGQSVGLMINIPGVPLYANVAGEVRPTALGGFGLMVDPAGMLGSLAFASSPSKQINALLAPGGYMGDWCRANGCSSMIEALYASAYTGEAVFGYLSQQATEPVELVTNNKDGIVTQVGMSLVPPIYLVNFLLMYALNPDLAALMPTNWTGVPDQISEALWANSGQVPYADYASLLPSYEERLKPFAGTAPVSNGGVTVSDSAVALENPSSSAVDSDGNLFIADTGNNLILKVASDGSLSVVAGGGAVSPLSTVVATDARLDAPRGVAVDADGNVFIADSGNNLILKVSPVGLLTVIAGGGANSPLESGPATSMRLSNPGGVAVDRLGNVYVADTGNGLVEEIDATTQNLYVLAGGGTMTPQESQASTTWADHYGPGRNVHLDAPEGITVDASGIVYVASTGDDVIIRLISATMSVVAGGGSSPLDGGRSATAVALSGPRGVTVTPSGALYIADTGNGMVSRMEAIIVEGTAVRPSFTG